MLEKTISLTVPGEELGTSQRIDVPLTVDAMRPHLARGTVVSQLTQIILEKGDPRGVDEAKALVREIQAIPDLPTDLAEYLEAVRKRVDDIGPGDVITKIFRGINHPEQT